MILLSNSAKQNWRFTLLGTYHPTYHTSTRHCKLVVWPWNRWFFFCWWICNTSYSVASAHSSSFFQLPLLSITVFMKCSGGERPATPLYWVALNGEKKGGRKIPLGTSPNEQINASVPQEMWRVRKREKLLGPQGLGLHSHTEAVTKLYE